MKSLRLSLMALLGVVMLSAVAPAMAQSEPTAITAMVQSDLPQPTALASLHKDGVVVAAKKARLVADSSQPQKNPLNVSEQDLKNCMEMRKAPGGFNPVAQYTCAYIMMAAHSLPLADKAKLEQFVKDWQPSVWTSSDYLKDVGTEQEKMDRTYALIRRMRDALGNPEPFDYVFTPQRMMDQQQNVVRPTIEGGIGALLKLENDWQIYQSLAEAAKNKDLSDEDKQKLYETAMTIGPDHRLIIRSPVPGSPSAGVLKQGDVVVAVDGKKLDGMTMDAAVKLIRGTLGTNVKLDILRTNSKGVQVPLSFTLLRSNVANHTVIVTDVDGVRHIQIGNFENDLVVSDFYQALVEAKAKGMKGIVVDVRGNPGGRLDYVKAMLEMIVDNGRILMTRQREPGTDKVIQTEFVMDGVAAITETMVVGEPETSKGFQVSKRVTFDARYNAQMQRNPGFVDENPVAAVIDPSMPVVVLLDGNSYSASEIFAGAINGSRRGIVIGQPSAGKDDIMTQLPLPECAAQADKKCNRGGLAIISGLFYPGGNDTDLTGVIPDRIVELAKDYGKTDAQLEAAIASVNDAHNALVAREKAAADSKKKNSDRFKMIIEKRNANDLLPPDKQNPNLQQ